MKVERKVFVIPEFVEDSNVYTPCNMDLYEAKIIGLTIEFRKSESDGYPFVKYKLELPNGSVCYRLCEEIFSGVTEFAEDQNCEETESIDLIELAHLSLKADVVNGCLRSWVWGGNLPIEYDAPFVYGFRYDAKNNSNTGFIDENSKLIEVVGYHSRKELLLNTNLHVYSFDESKKTANKRIPTSLTQAQRNIANEIVERFGQLSKMGVQAFYACNDEKLVFHNMGDNYIVDWDSKYKQDKDVLYVEDGESYDVPIGISVGDEENAIIEL